MILKDIQLYIDSGWRTIPYDSISYNEEGKKVASPPIAWAKYRDVLNTEASPAGALICGDVLVVDCDTEDAARLIIKEAQWEGISTTSDLLNDDVDEQIGLIVKTKRGYHFYFTGDSDIVDCKGPKIDVQATDKKLVYLATEASEGKKIIACNKLYDEGKQVIRLHPVTDKLKKYLISLRDSREEQAAKKAVRYTGGVPLVKIDRGSNQFYKRLTPKSFRTDADYRQKIDKQGYLHPDDVKDGDGNDYLVSVAGILASDPTVDINSFWDIMEFINDQWTNPLGDDELNRKVVAYTEDKYEGCPFNYDEDWEKAQYSFEDVDGRPITLVYDTASSRYLVAELDTGNIYIKNSSDISTYYANRTGLKISAANLATMLPGVRTVFEPKKPFGLFDTKEFNTYTHNEYLAILNDEGAYSQEEIEDSKKCLTLKFFKHLFGEQTPYWLSFLRRKLTTFEYSSTTFCLFDIEGGAGKGALESFLACFVDSKRVTSWKYDSFKAKFTSDIEGKFFVFLNEYPDDYKERKANTDRIKDLTGSPISKIERKGQDPYDAPNHITYMITSNRVSIEVREGDRRFCIANCDKKFDKIFGGRNYFERMTSAGELRRLAIYLKYNVSNLDDLAYMQPPSSVAKEVFQEDNETTIDGIVKAMVNQEWDKLLALDSDTIIAQHDIVDLSAVGAALHLERSTTLTKEINKQFRLKGINIVKDYDRNHKYRLDKVITYLKYPKGTMSGLITVQQSDVEEVGGTRI